MSINVRKINDDECNDKYFENLVDMNSKADAIAENGNTQAVQEIKPIFDRLVAKSVAKVKVFMLNYILELKKPKTNTQIVKQNMARFKYFYQYLKRHSKDSDQEFLNHYSSTMSSLYLSKFKSYTTNLSRLESKLLMTEQLIIEAETMGFGFAKPKPMKQSVLLVGDRIKILEDRPLNIIPHVSEEKKETFTFEILFKATNMLLVDTCLSENMFLSDFFEETTLFSDVFSKVLTLIRKWVESYLETSHDVIGVFLMLRVVEKLTGRNIKPLDEYFEKVKMLLFSKFKLIIENNVKFIKQSKISDTTSMEIAKKYGALSTSIHLLNRDSELKKTVEILMDSLRKSMEVLFNDVPIRETKNKLIYLVNTYDVVGISFINHKLECTDGVRIAKLFEENVDRYIEEELRGYIGDLIDFVKKYEATLAIPGSQEDNKKKVDTMILEELVKKFEKNWKPIIKKMNDDVVASYPKAQTAMGIVRRVLLQLMLYYSRFNAIINLCYQDPPFRSSLIPNTAIMSEMRNYFKDI